MFSLSEVDALHRPALYPSPHCPAENVGHTSRGAGFQMMAV